MVQYIIAEIAGKQYKVIPNASLVVDYLGEVKTFECEKVLLKAENDKIEVGQPYLKTKVIFDVEGTERERKIRVATFHAKANYRRVKGARKTVSKIKMQA